MNTKLRHEKRVHAIRSDDSGFTLIELLIVIVVLGILAGIVVFGVAQFRANAEASACRADVRVVSTAADAYDAATGSYPSSMEELVNAQYLREAPAEGTYTFDASAKTVTRDPAC